HFAAWRIALGHSSPYGKVVVRDWYGDVGLVKSTLHLETQGEVRDSAGAVVGQKYVIEDYVYVLKSFVLEGPPGRLLPAVVALRYVHGNLAGGMEWSSAAGPLGALFPRWVTLRATGTIRGLWS